MDTEFQTGPLERDIQRYLAEHLDCISPGLSLLGTEYSVSFGRIDILAEDKTSLVAIELKLGNASRDAIGQLQSYMGELTQTATKQVRGVLVAAGLDAGAEAALRVARDIEFYKYGIEFCFNREQASPTSGSPLAAITKEKANPNIKKTWAPTPQLTTSRD